MTGKQKSFLTHFRRQGGTLAEVETFLQTHEPTAEMLKSLDLYYKIKVKKRKLGQLISLFSSPDVKSYLEKRENSEKVKKVDEISIHERKKRQKKLLECKIPNKKEVPSGPGRKTRYTRAQDAVVEKLLALGASDEEVWTTIGIGKTTYYEWRKVHQSFDDAVYIGKDYYNTQQAERALNKRMTGYTETYKEVEMTGDKKVKSVKIKSKVFAPDTQAIKFYLNNRAQHRWSERPDQRSSTASTPELDADRQAHLDGIAKNAELRSEAEKLLDEITGIE